MSKEIRWFDTRLTVELRLHADYEFYILVLDAIVDQMVHMDPLEIRFDFNE